MKLNCLFSFGLVLLINECYSAKVENDVKLYFFTRENPKTYTMVSKKNSKGIHNNRTTVFIIHGWMEKQSVDWYEDLKNAYLARDDILYNVIQVDWSKLGIQTYDTAKVNTRQAGNIIGDFIAYILEKKRLTIDLVEIVGHSLGGHVSGFLGKRVFKLTKQKVPRITALDPAGPYFPDTVIKDRLDKSDADVVVAIHTDGGFFGFKKRLGTIDFFPNGGSRFQPGCPELLDIAFCSHHRSWKFWIEAIRTKQFWGTECTSFNKFRSGKCKKGKRLNMVSKVTQKDAGEYYAITNSQSPFFKND